LTAAQGEGQAQNVGVKQKKPLSTVQHRTERSTFSVIKSLVALLARCTISNKSTTPKPSSLGKFYTTFIILSF